MVDATIEKLKPFGGVARELIEESRALGSRHLSDPGYKRLHDLVVEFLSERFSKGSEEDAWHAVEEFRKLEVEWRRTLELELQYGKVGIETLTAERLGKMRVEAEIMNQGPSPENASREITRMVNNITGKGNGTGA